MAAKHEFEEFEQVSGISHPSPNAKVHAVPSSLSPMKKSKTCSFFDGEVTDGKQTMRLFRFDTSVWRKLVEFDESKDTVALSNCEVKRSYKGEQLEILVTKRTDIEKSEKVFNIDSTNRNMGKIIILKEVGSLAPFQRVTVEVKVVHVDDVVEISRGKKKQGILIGDECCDPDSQFGNMKLGR